jgi:ABC-type Zn uptake system ZnuABC Zn-binding protein ZnuA
MSKQATKPEGEAPKAEPTVADLMAVIAQMQAHLAAQIPAAVKVDFEAEVAEATAKGFKAHVVPSLQKGASPALRVDH